MQAPPRAFIFYSNGMLQEVLYQKAYAVMKFYENVSYNFAYPNEVGCFHETLFRLGSNLL